ncbi:MAG: DUF4857 domain-containing protein [Deferribacteraceae bacterium]|jgi:hypothetical protein|nr:DUF4857 domain-containing protein [Deferribacteraceae bacterium]
MKPIAGYLVILSAILSFAWGLPFFYSMAAKKKAVRPFVSYSVVIDDFVYSKQSRGKTVYMDMAGNEYSLMEYEKLLPLFFTRDLQKWGEYPQDIGGVHIPAEKAVNFRDTARISPHFVDMSRARIQLFPLFEAESSFTSLEFPKELFRIKNRMEFINAADNRINREKSALFTEALKNENFAFPAKMISGNTYPRKPYDFGYFVLDAENSLYHIYQAKGEPVVKNTGIAVNNIAFMLIRENNHLPYYGLLVDSDGGVWQILKDGYKLFKLDVKDYDPYRKTLVYMLDPLNITLKVSDEKGEAIRITTLDGELVKEYNGKFERNIYGAGLYNALFPFILRNNPYKYGEYIDFAISRNYPAALIFSAVLAFLYLIFIKRAGGKRYFLINTSLIILSGIYAFAAILLLEGIKRRQ